jgi:hypothetical protein
VATVLVAVLFLAGLCPLATIQGYEPPTGGQEITGWSLYSLPDGKSEVQFPGKAVRKPMTKGGMAILETLSGKAVYIFAFTELPSVDPNNKAIVKKLFDGGRDGVSRSLKGGKVLKETDTTVAGYPAHDIDYDAPGLGIYRTRLIVTPWAFYQITVFGPQEFVDGAAAQKFRKSFRLKK